MKKIWIGVIVLLVVLCGAGSLALRMYQSARAASAKAVSNFAKVEKGDLEVSVVESGFVDAVQAVEVKSRVSGRIAQLLVDEGDLVKKGDLLAVIDPQETELQVQQQEANLRGAQSAVGRSTIEISQRQITARSTLQKAKARLNQVSRELKVQPSLSNASIRAAETAHRLAIQAQDFLIKVTQPNERATVQSELTQNQSSLENARRELDRRNELLRLGYIAGRDQEDAALQYDIARARMDSTKERAGRLELQQMSERNQAEQRVRQAQAELDRARVNQVQDALKRDEYMSALEDVRNAEAGLRDVQVLQKSRAQGQATVDQIASVLRDAKRQLGETEIRSPINGIISKRYVQAGELVASLSSFSSGTAIVRVEDRKQMMVALNINEIDVAKLQNGMEATVSVDAIPSHKLTGKIRKIAPSSDALQTQAGAPAASSDAVVKYRVETWLSETDPGLRSGMSAKCTFVSLRRQGVMRLPLEFVIHEGDKWYVELAESEKANAKVTRTEIKVGATTGAHVEVLSGVKLGSLVARPKFTGPRRQGMMEAGGQ